MRWRISTSESAARELLASDFASLNLEKSDTLRHHAPTASIMHFLLKLDLAAPASFFSLLAMSHFAAASFSHFFRKAFLAAPASFFSAAVCNKEALFSVKPKIAWPDHVALMLVRH